MYVFITLVYFPTEGEAAEAEWSEVLGDTETGQNPELEGDVQQTGGSK